MNSLALIREFLDERLGVASEKIVSDALLVDLGVDSLMMLELMFAFEDRFGIKVPNELENPNSVGDMVAAMDGLITAANAS